MRLSDLFKIFFIFHFALLASCSSVDLNSYKDNKPILIPQQFFNGELSAHGILKNRSGQVIRFFNAKINASWDEQGIGKLIEDFTFDDGEKQTRTWQLIPKLDNQYIAKANDVVGESLMSVKGNALMMNYVLDIPYQGTNIHVDIDDSMWLVQKNILMNESIMTKFGFTVGTISLVIIKHSVDL